MSEDVATQALLAFLNAVEAGVADAKHIIKAQKVGWDPNNIKWTQAEAKKGPYERSEDTDNADFKAMLKDIQSHKGFLQRDGYKYWVFQNGSTVGRRKK